MKKLLRILATVSVITAGAVLFTACKQFLADPEEFFSYWTAEVTATDYSIDKPRKMNKDGIPCIPSAADVTVTIKLRNPKNFTLVMPASPADAGNVINFPGLSPQPVYGTDYTLVQTANDKLALTYKPAFLKAHEWSNGAIGPEITFVSTDGRKFSKKFSVNLKADTAPVLEYAGIGKTTVGADEYYVLLFRVKDMDAMIGGQSVHKDVNTLNVTVGDVALPGISLTVAGTNFQTGENLLAASAVNPLDSSPLPGGSWILRLKTDVKVGGPAKEYAVRIKDAQGLSSALIRTSTKKTKLDVELRDGSNPITGTTPGSPQVFAGMSGKYLTAQAAPAGAVITGTVSRFSSSPDNWTQTDTVSGTTPVTINLPALDASENQALYKITLKAQLTGYDDSDEKTFYVKLLRQEVPVLKLKQDFGIGSDYDLYCISAGTKAYVTEDIISDAGQYTNTNPLVIYSMLSGQCKLELSASAGTMVKYKLGMSSVQSPSAPAEITLSGGAHTLEVWTVRGTIEGSHTTVHIKVVNAINSYGELKNVIQNTPEHGTGPGQHNYDTFINIKIGTDLSADSETAVTGGKKLMLSSPASGTVRTVNANNSGRIFKISGTDSQLDLQDIQLEGGYAADGKGGAVCVEAGGALGLDGKTVITPSTAPDTNTRGKNDVYLANGAKIILDGGLASTNPIVARITPATYAETTQVLDGHNLTGGTTPAYKKFTVTQQDDGFLWKIKGDGTLKKTIGVINGTDSGAWKMLKDAVQNFPAGSTITIDGEIEATNDFGDDDRGVIDIIKNLTIQGKTGANSDMLNANRGSLGSYAHPIFRVSGGKTLTLKNLTLKGGIDTGGTFGGAINVAGSGSKAELTGCIIDDCEAEYGGAIGCGKGTTVNLTNTTVQNCKATSSSVGIGGAINAEGATVNITNCTLKGNEADHGGAIYATLDDGTGSTVTVTGGTIGGTNAADANKATAPNGEGGGISIGSGCTLNLQNNVQLIGNTARNGGGVYAFGGTVTLTNCTLKGNTAKSGGAIYAKKSGSNVSTVTITGGTIGGTNPTDANKATGTGTDNGMGGGIYIGEDCTLTMQNNAQIIGNTARFNGAGIYTKGTLTIKSSTITDNKTTVPDNNTGGGGVYVESGSVEIKDATKIYHNYTGGSGGGIYVNAGTVTLKNATIGGEQLYNGSDPDKTKGNDAQYYCGGIYVKNGAINMENCTLSSNTAPYGGGILAYNGNHTVKDCTLTNNQAYFYGGGIYVTGGSLTLNNTTIGGEQFYDGTDPGKTKGNKAKKGGGVYIEGSGTSFTMNGGSIQYNKTIDGGGVYIKGNGTSFTMNDGKITQCKADVTSPGSSAGRGGGIYGDNTSSPINITIKGTAEISHNESTCQGTASGGGIYGGSNSIITVSENATIKNNKAKGFGGGVYFKSTFIFTGGTITGNTITLGADKSSAGIFLEESSTTLKMSGNARVTNDNDIYLNRDSVITITGGALTGTAPVARITPRDYTAGMKVLGGDITAGNPQNYTKFTVTPKDSKLWTVKSDGRLSNRLTDIFANITKDQIEAEIEAAIKNPPPPPSTIYGEGQSINPAILNGKLILYRTQAQGHFNYGIMHVTNVNNSGGGSIKFNYKTFRKFEGDVLQKNDETVHGGASFNLDSEVSGASGNDFQLGNAASQFEILDYAKFYILPN